jgi:hypothetical protein
MQIDSFATLNIAILVLALGKFLNSPHPGIRAVTTSSLSDLETEALFWLGGSRGKAAAQPTSC